MTIKRTVFQIPVLEQFKAVLTEIEIEIAIEKDNGVLQGPHYQ